MAEKLSHSVLQQTTELLKKHNTNITITRKQEFVNFKITANFIPDVDRHRLNPSVFYSGQRWSTVGCQILIHIIIHKVVGSLELLPHFWAIKIKNYYLIWFTWFLMKICNTVTNETFTSKVLKFFLVVANFLNVEHPVFWHL